VLPRLATPQDDHPFIVSKRIKDPVITRTLGIVERRHAHLSPAAQRVRDMLAANWSDAAKDG
jgi:DNA-binding transcriptional LysR family regulator